MYMPVSSTYTLTRADGLERIGVKRWESLLPRQLHRGLPYEQSYVSRVSSVAFIYLGIEVPPLGALCHIILDLTRYCTVPSCLPVNEPMRIAGCR